MCSKIHVHRTKKPLVADTTSQRKRRRDRGEEVVTHIRRSSFKVVKKAQDMMEKRSVMTILIVNVITTKGKKRDKKREGREELKDPI